MRRHIPGLHQISQSRHDQLDGVFLVRVEQAFYRWHPNKPFFILRFSVLQPHQYAGQILSGRLYSSARALWKLHWFLRDFGYDADLFGRDEVDEKALKNLRGIVRISHLTLQGNTYPNLEGFAPEADWEEFAVTSSPEGETAEASHDL
ncbi:MAG: hypothetical protein ACYC93_16045 [Candidatus Acidiferrales bacterium]